MKSSIIYLFFGALALLGAGIAQAADPVHTIDIQVSGMTCPFCVYGVKKKLEKLPGVARAQVSLDKKLARITPKPGQALDMDGIRKAITEAGFTPGKVLSGKMAEGAPK
jgi:copper chaperone CopZ